MPKLTNINYVKFLKEGIIKTVSEDTIKLALTRPRKHKLQARALIITLYFTGARPNEVLRIKSGDIARQDNYITVKLLASKNGMPRTVFLNPKNILVKELYNYAVTLPPDMFLFYNFTNKYTRTIKGKEYNSNSDRLRYHFKQWFDGIIDINPYYLRHNRFSKLAEAGATMEQIRLLKGSKTFESISPYIHLSTESAKKLSKYLK